MDLDTLPEIIRSIRTALHLTQAEMAKRIRVTEPSVYRYESAKSIPNPATLKELYELARELGHEKGVLIFGAKLAALLATPSATAPQATKADSTRRKASTRTGIARSPTSERILPPSRFDNLLIPFEPNRLARIVPVPSPESKVPPAVIDSLSGAKICLHLSLFSASLMLSRSAIQVTIWQQFPNSDASHLIEGPGLRRLRKNNIIDERVFQWGLSIIDICNRGVHGLQSVTAEDAADALKFACRLADYIYVLPTELLDFSERRPTLRDGHE
jgi:transcriptional regulator with XRE-family HTH domain